MRPRPGFVDRLTGRLIIRVLVLSGHWLSGPACRLAVRTTRSTALEK